LNAHELPEPFTLFDISGVGGAVPVLPFGVGHGHIRSLGFRFGRFAYCPDVDALSDRAFEVLAGVECWIVDALRRRPHPSHAHLGRTLDWIARVRPRRAILTNMHIDMDYQTLRRDLPPNVEPAYDGMRIAL
jgi:phosphoribosyl 1,2-cyclic phosphate phosphodiesterase